MWCVDCNRHSSRNPHSVWKVCLQVVVLQILLLTLLSLAPFFSSPTFSTSVRCVCPGCSLACAAVAMKNPGAAQSLRLVGLLEAALVREARLWKVPVFKNGCIQVRRLSCTCWKGSFWIDRLWTGEIMYLKSIPLQWKWTSWLVQAASSTVHYQTVLKICVSTSTHAGVIYLHFSGRWHLFIPTPRNDHLAWRNEQVVPLPSRDLCTWSLCPQPSAVHCQGSKLFFLFRIN